MPLKVISIILYVLAGFFLTCVDVIAFVNVPSTTVAIKLIMLCIFGVPAVILIVIAAALNKFRRWKFAVGTVLVSAMCVAAFNVITFASILYSEETRKLFPDKALNMFDDYVTGVGAIVVLLSLGILLVKSEKKEIAT